MLIFWSCSQRVRAYQQVKNTCLVRPDSSVVRAFGICLEGPGFNPRSGRLFCLTTFASGTLCEAHQTQTDLTFGNVSNLHNNC
jgi:hypothetical protein